MKKNNVPEELDFSYFSPLQVIVNGNYDRAMKIFRALVQSERVLSLYKEKQSFEKPSVKHRRKQNEASRRLMEFEEKQRKIATGEYDKEKAKKLAKREQKIRENEEQLLKPKDE